MLNGYALKGIAFLGRTRSSSIRDPLFEDIPIIGERIRVTNKLIERLCGHGYLCLFLEEKYGKVHFFEDHRIGNSRADMVMVTEHALVGIEIKSDADSYARLHVNAVFDTKRRKPSPGVGTQKWLK